MDRLVDHLFVFEGDGVIRDFPGNYSRYREWLSEQDTRPAHSTLKNTEKEPGPGNSQVADTNRKTPQQTARRPSFKEKREFETLEKEITDLNQEKELITMKLNDSATPFEELQQLSVRIGQVTTLLDEKELRWLELSEII
jgi:ATP-binding cassette subfamily F protein uup